MTSLASLGDLGMGRTVGMGRCEGTPRESYDLEGGGGTPKVVPLIPGMEGSSHVPLGQ